MGISLSGLTESSTGNLTISAGSGSDILIGNGSTQLFVDGGTDTLGIGGTAVSGSRLNIETGAVALDFITSTGTAINVIADTVNDTSGAATLAIVPTVQIGVMTYTSSNSMTYTDTASLYIAGIPVASTNVTFTNAAYALWVDSGAVRFDDRTFWIGGIAYEFPANNGNANEFLLTDGSGNLSWSTVASAAASTTVTVTDNEATNENNLIPFVANAATATGNHGLEMDGDFTYSPNTGRLTATQLAGTLTTAAQAAITSVGTLTALTVDTLTLNADTISSSGDMILTPSGNDVYIGKADSAVLRVSSADHDIAMLGAGGDVDEGRLYLKEDSANAMILATDALTWNQAATISTTTGNLTIGATTGADVLIGDNVTILYVDGGTGGVGVGAAPSVPFHVNSGGTNTVARFESTDTIAFLQLMDNSTDTSYPTQLQTVGNVISLMGGSSGAHTAVGLSVIATGAAIVGHTASVTPGGGANRLQVHAVAGNSGLTIGGFSNDATAPEIRFAKSRNATIGSHTVIQAGDSLGAINFKSSDGSNWDSAASIYAKAESISGNQVGGALQIYTYTVATGAGGGIYIDNAHNVGIGTSSPAAPLDVARAAADTHSYITESSDSGQGPNLRLRRSRASDLASPTAIQSSNWLGKFSFAGHDGGGYDEGPMIRAATTETWASGAHGSYISFWTVDNTTTTQDERMRIDQNGSVLISNTGPASGAFATGADNLIVGDGANHDGITIYSGANHMGSIYFTDGGDPDGTQGYIQYGHGSQGEKMFFGSGGGTRMTIDTSGDIGIGTTSPSGSDWNASSKLLHIYQNDTNGALIKLESSNTQGFLGAGNGDLRLGTGNSTHVRFYCNDVVRLKLDTDGRNIFYTAVDLNNNSLSNVGNAANEWTSSGFKSEGQATFNEAGGDFNFRIESDNLVHMFHVDAGMNSVAIGAEAIASSAFYINGVQSDMQTDRIASSTVGLQLMTGGASAKTGNSNGTLPIGVSNATFPAYTWDNANANLTLTNSTTVYIAGPPTAGTNVIMTNDAYSLWVRTGSSMFGSTAQGSSIPIQVQGDYSAIFYRKADGVSVGLIGPRADIAAGHMVFHGYNSANWLFNNGNVSIGGTSAEGKLDVGVADGAMGNALVIGTIATSGSSEQKFRMSVNGSATDNRLHNWSWNWDTTGTPAKDDTGMGAFNVYVSPETTDSHSDSGWNFQTMLAGETSFVDAFQIRQDRGVFFYGATSGQDMYWSATSSGGSLIYEDNVKAKFGDSGDMEIVHNGNDSYISAVVDGRDFYIQTTVDRALHLRQNSTEAIQLATDGAVYLYHNGTSKLVTQSTGIESSGSNLDVHLRLKSTGTNSYPTVRFQNDTNTWRLYGVNGAHNNSFNINDETAGTWAMTISQGAPNHMILANYTVPNAYATAYTAFELGSKANNIHGHNTGNGGNWISINNNAYLGSAWKGVYSSYGHANIYMYNGAIYFRVDGAVGADADITWQTPFQILTSGVGFNAHPVYDAGHGNNYWTSSAFYTTGTIYATGSITQNSDKRLKENIVQISSALDKVNRMRGVTYDLIDTGEAGVGVVAQELEPIAPDLIHVAPPHKDPEKWSDYKSVAYGNLTAYLIEAIKELTEKVDRLENGTDR